MWSWVSRCGSVGSMALLGLTIPFLPSGASAQVDPRVESVLDRALDLSGCYELRWGRWSEPGWSEEVERLPRRIWLTTSSFGPRYYPNDSSQVAVHFVMRPAPGEREVGYQDVTWVARSENDSIVVSWSSPFQGIWAAMEVTGSFGEWILNGRATAWTDEIQIVEPGNPSQDPPTVTVSGRMVDCGGRGGAEMAWDGSF